MARHLSWHARLPRHVGHRYRATDRRWHRAERELVRRERALGGCMTTTSATGPAPPSVRTSSGSVTSATRPPMPKRTTTRQRWLLTIIGFVVVASICEIAAASALYFHFGTRVTGASWLNGAATNDVPAHL